MSNLFRIPARKELQCAALVVFCVVLPIHPATSQDAHAALVQKVPENSAWTVRIIRSGQVPADPAEPIPDEAFEAEDSGRPTGELRRIEHEFSNGLRKITQHFRGGRPRTIFVISQAVFYDHPRTGDSIVSTPQDALIQGLPYLADRFHGFHWIADSNHIGEETFRGTVCDVYRQTLLNAPRGMYDVPQGFDVDDGDIGARAASAADTTDLSPEVAAAMEKTILRTAYVDKQSRLPVALEDAAGLHIYEFGELTAPPVLPEKHRRELSEIIKAQQRATNRYRIPQ